MADDRPKERLSSADIVVVGAGIGGSSIASLLARAGRSVLLVEKDELPRDKLCGEFLSPESAGFLARLGCLDALMSFGPAEIVRSRFTSGRGGRVELNLPAPGIGISRRVLDALLYEHARASGVSVLSSTEAVSVGGRAGQLELELVSRTADGGRTVRTVEAPIVIGAHGRRSRLDRSLHRAFVSTPQPYVGFKRHHRLRDPRDQHELEGAVEIHAVDGGYCGMSFVEDQQVNVCMLLEKRFLSRLPSSAWESIVAELAASNSALGSRLAMLEPVDSTILSVAQIPFVDKERYRDGVFFIGDAAGMIAPLAGDGQAMALSSAFLLADLLATERSAAPARLDALGRRWDRAWRTRYALRMRLGRRLQAWLLAPKSADFAIRSLATIPGMASALVRLTRERGR